MATLTWNASSGATSYVLLRSTSSSGPFSQVGTGPTTSGSDYNGLAYNTTYYYEVEAVGSGGTSAPCTPVSVTTLGALFTPSIKVVGNSIVLGWATQTGTLFIWRSTTGGAYQADGAVGVVIPQTSTGFTDKNLALGTSYSYWVFSPARGWVGAPVSATSGSMAPINIVPNPTGGYLPNALTLPSWAESAEATDSASSPGGGPASAFDINLAFGGVDVDSGPDLVAANPTGSSVAFERRYRTALAAGNLSSPGLPPGWTHNWDYRIVPTTVGQWGPLQLVYPNGASETLTPALDGNGNPTGSVTSPNGAPYTVSGVPSSTKGIWTSITIQHNGLSAENFGLLSGDSVYRLFSTTLANGSRLNFSYSLTELTSIDNSINGSQPSLHLSLAYGGNYLTSVTDLICGKSRTLSYTGSQLTAVSNIGNTATEYSYQYTTIGGQPYLSQVTTPDPQGTARSASVTYDSTTGRPTTLTDAKSNLRNYNFGTPESTSVGISGNVGNPDNYSAQYDSMGRLAASVTAAGDTTGYQYGSIDTSLVTSIQPPLGRSATTVTDNHGNPTQITYPFGNYLVITWEYPTIAPLGRITSIQEHGNDGVSVKQPTLYTYYAAGDPNGLNGYLKTVQTPNGGVTTYTYTSLGDVLTVVGPSTSVTFGYGPGTEVYGCPTSVTDALGNTTLYTYDSSMRLTGMQDPLGNVTQAAYNQYDQPTNITFPLGKSVVYAYTVNGKQPTNVSLNALRQAPATIGVFTYDAESGLSKSADGNNNADSTSLDSQFGLNQLANGNSQIMHQFAERTAARAVDMQIGTGSGSYSATAVMDRNGNPSSSSGSDGRTTAVTPSSSDVNLPGLVTCTDSAGNVINTQYFYDAFGRANTITRSGTNLGITPRVIGYDDEDNIILDGSVSYTYNLDGSRKTMSFADIQYQYGYDADARLISINAVDVALGTSPIVAWANYTYDKDNRVVAVRTPMADTFYTYDALGQLTSLQNVTPDGEPYLPAGSQAQINDPFIPNSTHTIIESYSNITYNLRGQRLGMSFVARRSASPGPDGQLSDGPITYGSGSVAWTYDSGGRLTNEVWTGAFGNPTLTQPPLTRTYGYDAADNLTTVRGLSQSLDSASDELSTTASNPYLTAVSYNSSGEQSGLSAFVQWGWGYGFNYSYRRTATFSCMGELFASQTYDSLGNNTSEVNSFDDLGRRTAYSTLYNGGSGSPVVSFYYDGESLIGLSNPNDTFSPRYLIVGPTGPVLQFQMFDGTAQGDTFDAQEFGLLYDPQGNLVDNYSSVYFGNTYVPTTNAVPSTFTAFPYYVNNVAYFSPQFYDAYGLPVWIIQDGTKTFQTAFAGGFGYKGQFGYITDPDGLIYCHNRFYDPNTGRWISRDPSGLEGGVNTYEYCADDPVNLADPSGLDWGWIHWLYDGARTAVSFVPVVGPVVDGVDDAVHGRWANVAGDAAFLGLDLIPGDQLASAAAKLGRRTASLAIRAGGETSVKALERVALIARNTANVRNGLKYEARLRALGVLGDKLVGYIEHDGRLRKPDGINELYLFEAKDRKYLGLSSQLNAYIGIAKERGLILHIFVATRTTISGPLEKLISEGEVKLTRQD